MINIKCNSELEIYAARQLNLMLGILVEDDIYLSFLNDGEAGLIKLKLNNEIHEHLTTKYLELCSDFLTLKRESTLPKDKLGRVCFTKEQADDISFPFLDDEVKRLRTLIQKFLCKNNVSYTRVNFINEPSVCLSHDVDSLKSNSIIRFAYNFLRSVVSLNFSSFFNYIKKKSAFLNTHADIRKFVQVETEYNFRSTYFFLSLPFFLGREGRRYSVRSGKIKKIIRYLIENKFEIGMHTSRKGFSEIKLGKAEIKRLKKATGEITVAGVRNHYLQGNFPKLWNVYENLFDYDSSLGSSEYIVYRSGTSNPFQPFDYNLNRELDILEVPLIVMDGAITGNCEEIFNKVKEHIDIAFDNRSLITILWHTDRIIPDEFTEHSYAYEKVLAYLFQLNFSSLTINEAVLKYKDYKQKMDSNINIL